MSSKSTNWIPMQGIEANVQPEPVLVIIGLCVISWLIYKIFMRSISVARHGYLKRDFFNLLAHAAAMAICFSAYWTVQQRADLSSSLVRALPYLGFAALLTALVTLVKVMRILVYQYLIFSHMRVGVPLLIRNIFTLVFSIVLAGWTATSVFGVNLAPLLATSAVFSVVLGLALQDTLGNIFAGISMQLDWKPFEIGDWIEIIQDGPPLLGEVHEISWRSITLIGPKEERIIVPNRMLAQSQINSYSTRERPMIRTQTYRLPFEVNAARVKEILLEAVSSVPVVRREPKPLVIVPETTESWVAFRVVYFIDNFGAQFLIGDKVNMAVLEALDRAGIKLARSRIVVERETDS